ncbi:MAG: hypothetical protein H6Q15_508 [Bacteroidetes bacterium]|nr:hypothetical protein [Bacteroidota bacterium]
MKKLLSFCIVFLLATSLYAQLYEANKWYVGPAAGAGYNNLQMKIDDNFNNHNFKYDVGAYLGYSFSDLLGVQVDALYSGGFGSFESKSIQIPAMVTIQFLRFQHFGVGLMYNYCFENPKGYEGIIFHPFTSVNNNYLSVIAEFSTLLARISKVGNIVYFLGGEVNTRCFIRGGLALTPCQYTIATEEFEIYNDVPLKMEYKPFFIEFGLRLDLISRIKGEDVNAKTRKGSKKSKRRR